MLGGGGNWAAIKKTEKMIKLREEMEKGERKEVEEDWRILGEIGWRV